MSRVDLLLAAWFICRAINDGEVPWAERWEWLCRLRDRWRLGWTDAEMQTALDKGNRGWGRAK